MSKIKNGGLRQYGDDPFEQQQFWTADVEGVKEHKVNMNIYMIFKRQTWPNEWSRYHFVMLPEEPHIMLAIMPSHHNIHTTSTLYSVTVSYAFQTRGDVCGMPDATPGAPNRHNARNRAL